MTCPQCKMEIVVFPTTQFCAYCGVSLTTECPACRRIHLNGFTFCPATGENVKKIAQQQEAEARLAEASFKQWTEQSRIRTKLFEEACKTYPVWKKVAIWIGPVCLFITSVVVGVKDVNLYTNLK